MSHHLIALCLQQLTSLKLLTSTSLCSNFTKAAVNSFFANQSRRFWWLFSKAFCERIFVCIFALQSHLEYLQFFRCYAVLWVPDFLHAPNDQGSSSGQPQDVGPSCRSDSPPGESLWFALEVCPLLSATSAVLAPRQGQVIVGDTLALLLPVPASLSPVRDRCL